MILQGHSEVLAFIVCVVITSPARAKVESTGRLHSLDGIQFSKDFNLVADTTQKSADVGAYTFYHQFVGESHSLHKVPRIAWGSIPLICGDSRYTHLTLRDIDSCRRSEVEVLPDAIELVTYWKNVNVDLRKPIGVEEGRSSR